MKPNKWTVQQLKTAVTESTSIRQVLALLGLKQAGGNYFQIKKYLLHYQIDTSHFQGQKWRKGSKIPTKPITPLEDILKQGSIFQSYKLKKRLFRAGLKEIKCEECSWKQMSEDGRIPLELDHINGDSKDNRLENLRILCPNCHSLKPTHRGKNKKKG